MHSNARFKFPLPLNLSGGLTRLPASRCTTHLSSTNLFKEDVRNRGFEWNRNI